MKPEGCGGLTLRPLKDSRPSPPVGYSQFPPRCGTSQRRPGCSHLREASGGLFGLFPSIGSGEAAYAQFVSNSGDLIRVSWGCSRSRLGAAIGIYVPGHRVVSTTGSHSLPDSIVGSVGVTGDGATVAGGKVANGGAISC